MPRPLKVRCVFFITTFHILALRRKTLLAILLTLNFLVPKFTPVPYNSSGTKKGEVTPALKEITTTVLPIKLRKKAQIVFKEKTNVLNPIFQHCHALYSHTKGITRIDLGVYSTSFKNVRIYHSAP